MIDANCIGIHTVVMHVLAEDSWLARARDRDLRATLAAGIVELVSGLDERSIIAFPAGYLTAPNTDAALAIGEEMAKVAAAHRVGLAFGVRLAAPEPWEPLGPAPAYYGFACDGSRRVLWPDSAEEPVVTLRGRKVGVLLGSQVFDRGYRTRLARERPEVILLLTSSGTNHRWNQALDAARRIAPTIVIGESDTGGMPPWAEPPDGWVRHDLSTTPNMTLVKYEAQRSPTELFQALATVGDESRSVKD